MALEKIQKLPTFTDAEEGGSEGRKGRRELTFPSSLKKKGETKKGMERITKTSFIKDDYRSHGQTALMAILPVS